jgi:L-ascorbate metabolism protein UlaG (beta-lactamase superfamily)
MKVMAIARVLAGVLLAVITACSRLGPGVDGLVDLTPPGAHELRLTYLGVGGWILEHGDDMILTAPFFTNPGFVRTGLASIATDTLEVDRQMSRYDVRRARAILTGHAHYDHLMDVPRVATSHAPDARIVGSRTVANTLGSWSGVGSRVDVVNDSVGDQKTAGRWLRYGRGVRVMPLRSRHAPHFDGYTLYQGTVQRPRTVAPRYASEWLDGETFAFLIDFMDASDSVAFRVYYQDAVVAPPLGFAPDELIAERPVDVAILVPATFDQVDWHPEAFVENLQPRRVLLGHWEDFFAPVDAPTRALMLSDLGHFQDRLERVFDGEWWRPELWTEFRFPR